WIVMKALDKDRSRRYESPNQLASDVRRYLAGEAIVAAPANVAYRLRKFLRRHRPATIVGASLAAGILLALAGITPGLVQARHSNTILRESTQTAQNALGRVLAETLVGEKHDKPVGWSDIVELPSGKAYSMMYFLEKPTDPDSGRLLVRLLVNTPDGGHALDLNAPPDQSAAASIAVVTMAQRA